MFPVDYQDGECQDRCVRQDACRQHQRDYASCASSLKGNLKALDMVRLAPLVVVLL